MKNEYKNKRLSVRTFRSWGIQYGNLSIIRQTNKNIDHQEEKASEI